MMMRGTWGTAELVLALAAGGWAFVMSLGEPRVEAFWPICAGVGALFFLIAAMLFYAGHPDGGVVGLFGLLFYTAALGILPIVDDNVRDGRLWAILGALAVVAAAQSLILVGVGRKPAPPAEEPAADAP